MADGTGLSSEESRFINRMIRHRGLIVTGCILQLVAATAILIHTQILSEQPDLTLTILAIVLLITARGSYQHYRMVGLVARFRQ